MHLDTVQKFLEKISNVRIPSNGFFVVRLTPANALALEQRIEENILRDACDFANDFVDADPEWDGLRAEMANLEAAGIEPALALALFVGWKACQPMTENADLIKNLRFTLPFKKGLARESYRRRIRDLDGRPYLRAQNLIFYGFMLRRGETTVSRTTVRSLSKALLEITWFRAQQTEEPWVQLYKALDQRIRRLKKSDENAEAEAEKIFSSIYAIVSDSLA